MAYALSLKPLSSSESIREGLLQGLNTTIRVKCVFNEVTLEIEGDEQILKKGQSVDIPIDSDWGVRAHHRKGAVLRLTFKADDVPEESYHD